MPRFRDWLDDRTGYRCWVAAYRARTLPDGPRWQYVTASCLVWMLAVEVVTGILLMATYSPSTNNAWASVHFVDQMAAGRFLRGLHYFAGQAILGLFLLHLVRVLVTRAFRPPRELIWITGLLLTPVILFWAVSGNPLRWSQTGYGQIQVEGNILGSIPVVGEALRRMLIGGDDLGHLTLTRLYALHVAVLPFLTVLLLAIHIQQVIRHGLWSGEGESRSGVRTPYFPHQTLRNVLAAAILLAIVSILAWSRGAPLGVPADPTLPSDPRPEWYFLFLFELRRYFTGPSEVIATLVIPSAILLFLIGMPLLDRRLPPRWSAGVCTTVAVGGVVAWGSLTIRAMARDWKDPQHQAVLQRLAELSDRARQLAERDGVPPEGPAWLLRRDPQTRGPALFAEHCANCHRLGDRFPHGQKAADLEGFGTEAWIRGLLTTPSSPRYFGHTELSEMSEWVEGTLVDLSEEERGEIDEVARWLAGHPRGLPGDPDESESEFHKGLDAFRHWCSDCHQYEGIGEAVGPDLTGYGSREWVRAMLADPAGTGRYSERNTMPSMADRLTAEEIDLLAQWLTNEATNGRGDDDATDR